MPEGSHLPPDGENRDHNRDKQDRGRGQVPPNRNAGEVSRLLYVAEQFECIHQAGEPFVRFTEDGAYKTQPAHKDHIGPVLTDWYEDTFSEQPSPRAVELIASKIARRCIRRGVHQMVSYRSAPLYECSDYPDRLTGVCLDLGDNTWAAIKVDAAGVHCLDKSPVPLRRHQGMLAIPPPLEPEDWDTSIFQRLQAVAPLPDQDSQWVRLAFLLTSIWPLPPYPVLKLVGPPVSGKTFHARVLRRIIDPIETGIRGLDRDEEAMLRIANTEWLVVLDNVDIVPPWLSSVLCRLSTGAGQKLRTMYADTVGGYRLAKPVIITSLRDELLRADLMSRSLVINLPDPEGRPCWDDHEAMAKLERELPSILHGLYDLLRTVLAAPERTPVGAGSRLTSVNRIMAEVEDQLGFSPGTWDRVLQRNQAEMYNSKLEETPTYVELMAQMLKEREQSIYDSRGELTYYWEGTISDLLKLLNVMAKREDRDTSDWPASPNRFSRELRSSSDALKSYGLLIDWTKQQRLQRIIRVSRI